MKTITSILLFLTLSASIFAQKQKDKPSLPTTKDNQMDDLSKEPLYPAYSDNYGLPDAYFSAPFMKKWKFPNTIKLALQWVTVLQLKSTHQPCSGALPFADIVIAKTSQGDTIRLISICGKTIDTTAKKLMIEGVAAPKINYITKTEEMEEINPDRSRTPYIKSDYFDDEVVDTYYVSIYAFLQ